MAVEADAVAQAVGEEFVVGAETGGGDDCAGGIIDGAGEFAGARGGERGVLRFADGVEARCIFSVGLPKTPVRVTSDQ